MAGFKNGSRIFESSNRVLSGSGSGKCRKFWLLGFGKACQVCTNTIVGGMRHRSCSMSGGGVFHNLVYFAAE